GSGWGDLAEVALLGVWCTFIAYLLRKQGQNLRLFVNFGTVIVIAAIGLTFVEPTIIHGRTIPLSVQGELYARIGLAVYGVLLTENLFRNTAPEFRWHIKLMCLALGGMFAYVIVLYADALLFQRLSHLLWAGRAITLIVVAPLIAVSVARNRDWSIDIHVSRSVVFHTATLVGTGIFLLALAITGELVRTVGSGWGDLAEVALVITGVAVIAVLLSSGAARSRLRRFVTENFFTHRYDYRREWLKSSEILSAHPSRMAVQTRVISAIAEIGDSPAGVLWVRDVDGAAFRWAGSWNCPAIGAVEPADSAFIAQLRNGDWVIDLATTQHRPEWLDDIRGAWLVVPLAQDEELIGFIVLVEPRAPLKPDRETFDLLRIVGRQAATHIAEQRHAQALADARELHDYSKRFAFVVHDMKNIAGQLQMIVQNARNHGDNPEFHQDVLNTVRSALDRLNGLLTKLRPDQGRGDPGYLTPINTVHEVAAAIHRSRGIAIGVEHDGLTTTVAMDPSAFRSVILHLCENAIEASGEAKVCVRHEPMRLQIDIVDNGEGMSPEFIRDKLFRPFGSTKGGGFGIGAYQARELIRAAGGDLLVTSRLGSGTRMRIMLPCTSPRPLEASSTRVEAAG
ncbi:MAG: PEP-CTERM system histidine kinase PrsK, partial [Deltaproteobacteria bacterium]|nr:PEP-CTERM system histidine kinase PrsK [Deltaproteobacteria bacterium]